MKKIILILAAMALLVGGWLFWRFLPSDESPDTLKLYGNVDIRQVSLAFEQGGRVTELFAEEGDRVTRGQLLARVDVTGLRLEADKLRADIAAQEQNLLKMKNGNRPEEIARAEAALRTAEASLEQAKRNDARMASLRRGNSVSAQERENAQTSLRVAQGQRDEAAHTLALLREGYRDEDIAMAAAQLSSARAALAVMQHNIELGELFSPTDAVVSSRLLEPGDMASSATPVFLLSLTSPKWVRAYVTEPQLGRIRQGMKADILTDSFPEAVPGRVGYISPTAEFTPKSVQTEDLRTSLLYEVRIVADDADDRLRLGMPVSVVVHEDAAGVRHDD
ncbi:HlyD family efflux transporter periplasmic adaptor subunit [uncultured Mailhella sp.]|uniref:efflux RND transporter periplasmic adaptor subunit n=1 Tax=uncultured Mailhella sp. TaxID=1981031 RepID=UPI0025EBD526|nr:HlyD family efflux transporter periplasmic adaptor subunit [uncultured Mailhella sp.]